LLVLRHEVAVLRRIQVLPVPTVLRPDHVIEEVLDAVMTWPSTAAEASSRPGTNIP
jgi:hypothetical protein